MSLKKFVDRLFNSGSNVNTDNKLTESPFSDADCSHAQGVSSASNIHALVNDHAFYNLLR